MAVALVRVRRVLEPVFEGLAATPVLVVLWMLHLGGRSPLWLLLGAVVAGSLVGGEHMHRRVGGPALDRRVHLRLAVDMGLTAVILYLLGWGPTLAPAFVIPFGLHLQWGAPARTWRPLLLWSLVAIGCGQLAIAAGLVYSYIPAPGAHGLAALSALVLVLVMRLLGVASEDRERQETERRRAEDALRDNEQRYRALVHNATDMVVITDPEGVPAYVSPSAERLSGHRAESLLGVDPRPLLHPDDVAVLDTAIAEVLQHSGAERPLEVRFQHGDGSWRWHAGVIRNLMDAPAVGGLVINTHDVTERRELEDLLRRQALHDPLTALANRTLFADRLEYALARTNRHDTGLAVVLIDLDDFKSVNDSLGHATGDDLIKAVARDLQAVARASDTVARLGGDEFAIVLTEVSGPDDARRLVDRVLATLKRGYDVGNRHLSVTASIGVAMATSTEADAEDLLRQADVAMYAAKNGGKGRVAVFEPGMQIAVHERLQLRTDLVDALAVDDQLRVHYQPIVDLHTGRATGVEALARWDHPVLGRIPACAFIAVAEESELIEPLGRWVLDEACRQLRQWHRERPELRDLWVSVNVSPGQLGSPTFVEDVRRALSDHGLDPGAVVLEVTESTLLHDTPAIDATFRDLKSLGVRLAIDDFGAGYSSLRHLQRVPVDLVKIDRGFVTDVSTDRSRALIVDSIVRLGHGLGIDIVAEGIETPDERATLNGLGCRYGQGYLIRRPDEAAAVAPFLLSSREPLPAGVGG